MLDFLVSTSESELLSDLLWSLGVVAVEERDTTDNFITLSTSLGDDHSFTREIVKQKFPNVIAEIRGVGLMLGIKLQEKYIAANIVSALKDQGVLLVGAGENVMRILPPLIISEENIFEAIKILQNSFQKIS